MAKRKTEKICGCCKSWSQEKQDSARCIKFGKCLKTGLWRNEYYKCDVEVK